RSCSAEPVMSEEFHLRFADPSSAERASQQLLELRQAGERLINARRDGHDVMAGCAIFHPVPPGTEVHGPGGVTAFDTLFYEVDTTKSGMHHRDGMLWIRPPKGIRGRATPGYVPLESLAPTMLSMLGVHPAPAMKGAVLTDI